MAPTSSSVPPDGPVPGLLATEKLPVSVNPPTARVVFVPVSEALPAVTGAGAPARLVGERDVGAGGVGLRRGRCR